MGNEAMGNSIRLIALPAKLMRPITWYAVFIIHVNHESSMFQRVNHFGLGCAMLFYYVYDFLSIIINSDLFSVCSVWTINHMAYDLYYE